MPYRVIKDDDIIDSPDDVETSGGVLICKNSDGYVETLYSPGFWDTVFWDED